MKINELRAKIGIKIPERKIILPPNHSGFSERSRIFTKTRIIGGSIVCKECGFHIKSVNHENGRHHKETKKKAINWKN